LFADQGESHDHEYLLMIGHLTAIFPLGLSDAVRMTGNNIGVRMFRTRSPVLNLTPVAKKVPRAGRPICLAWRSTPHKTDGLRTIGLLCRDCNCSTGWQDPKIWQEMRRGKKC